MLDQRTMIPIGTIEVVSYGASILFRATCPDCGDVGFVIQGETDCCHVTITPTTVIQTRAASATRARGYFSVKRRDALLDEQGGQCFYCRRMIYSAIRRRRREVVLRPEIDHFVPYSYIHSRTGLGDNTGLVIACHLCNRFKSSMVFLDPDAAREYLAQRWTLNGCKDL